MKFIRVQKMAAAVADRVQAGIDSEIEGSRARLSLARVRLRLAEASGAADVLRQRLSKLTGLPAAAIEIDADSVPASADAVKKMTDSSGQKDVASNPAVQAAVEHARAQYLRVEGERKSLWPSIDFAAQYALLATYNNYQKFYNLEAFQPNNATVGVAIHLPFLNLAQQRVCRRRRRTLKAKKQAASRAKPGLGTNPAPAALSHADAGRPRGRGTRIRNRAEKYGGGPNPDGIWLRR